MPAGKTIRILLADDDADDRQLFESAYKALPNVLLMPSVVNGREVLKSLDETESSILPHLIVLDQNMPLLNGKQTLTALKSNDRYTSIPVCIYSTYADKPLVDSCLKLGAAKVLSKPVTEREYLEMMGEFLRAV